MRDGSWLERMRGLVASVERRFGRGVLVPLPSAGSSGATPDCAAPLATGIAALDGVLGGPGLARGAIVEVFGAEGVGKTSLALALATAVQREGGVVAWIDVERALQPRYAEAVGVDASGLLLSRPDDAEEALELVEALARSGEVALIVIDSVAALLSRQDATRPLDDDAPVGPGRLLSRALPRLAVALHDSGCVAVFVNQMRRELADGAPQQAAAGGGVALRHYASLRLELSRAGALQVDRAVAGEVVRAEVVKSRFGAPGAQALLAMHYGRGFVPDPLALPRAQQRAYGAEAEAIA